MRGKQIAGVSSGSSGDGIGDGTQGDDLLLFYMCLYHFHSYNKHVLLLY